MGAYWHSFDEVIEVLKKYNTKKECYESLGVTKQAFFRYLRIMREKGLLDEKFNIIEKPED